MRGCWRGGLVTLAALLGHLRQRRRATDARRTAALRLERRHRRLGRLAPGLDVLELRAQPRCLRLGRLPAGVDLRHRRAQTLLRLRLLGVRLRLLGRQLCLRRLARPCCFRGQCASRRDVGLRRLACLLRRQARGLRLLGPRLGRASRRLRRAARRFRRFRRADRRRLLRGPPSSCRLRGLACCGCLRRLGSPPRRLRLRFGARRLCRGSRRLRLSRCRLRLGPRRLRLRLCRLSRRARRLRRRRLLGTLGSRRVGRVALLLERADLLDRPHLDLLQLRVLILGRGGGRGLLLLLLLGLGEPAGAFGLHLGEPGLMRCSRLGRLALQLLAALLSGRATLHGGLRFLVLRRGRRVLRRARGSTVAELLLELRDALHLRLDALHGLRQRDMDTHREAS